jgi:hypothetical protein
MAPFFAQRQHVDARAPADLRRRAAEAGHGVGETRAIHMNLQSVLVRELRDFGDLRRLVDAAGLGRLGQAHSRRLRIVDVPLRPLRQLVVDQCRVELTVGTRQVDQLGAAAEQLGRTTLIEVDVRQFVAIDGTIGRRHDRKRQRVRGGAGGDGKYRHLRLEQLGDVLLDSPRNVVIAIAHGRAHIGRGQRGHDLRCYAGDVVTAEIHRSIPRYCAFGTSRSVPSSRPVAMSTISI